MPRGEPVSKSAKSRVRRFRIRHLLLHPSLMFGALFALFRARIALKSLSAADVMALNEDNRLSGSAAPRDGAAENAMRQGVSVAVTYLARLVPWRSDCVVQALAARHLLAARGISSEIHIGARKNAAHALDAHAWLMSGGQVITGASEREYALLVGSNADAGAEKGASRAEG